MVGPSGFQLEQVLLFKKKKKKKKKKNIHLVAKTLFGICMASSWDDINLMK